MISVICTALVCATAIIITNDIIGYLSKGSSSPIQPLIKDEAIDLQGEADKALDEANRGDEVINIFDAIKDIMIDLDEE